MSGKPLNPTGLDFTPSIHNDTYDFINPTRVDLSNRAVLITGASKGIGRATALSYARAGASYIAIAARSSLDSLEGELEEAAKKAGRASPKVLALQQDVTDNASVEKTVEDVEEIFGRLDIVISNAGYLEPFKPFLESKPEDWKRSYEVNVFGVYHVARAFIPLLLKTENGLKQIITITSIGAHNIVPGGSGYLSAKLAVLRFTDFIGVENPGIVTYGVHPGGVLTDLARAIGEKNMHLLIDQPELAADSLVWLTSERREWLNGRYISVTWDMEELLQKRQEIEEQNLLKVRMAVGTA
ncbi:NAD-P-binding protein [Teratosphaeria destructans]|uniref:NAD-P-binding protein n=1 Tax=Teratosphaeria destructans TaxID=418781 RepID=A0A9W7W0Q6_9PEZI|nr:NAD-P-binding protein [Teratosphaeria destructans]